MACLYFNNLLNIASNEVQLAASLDKTNHFSQKNHTFVFLVNTNLITNKFNYGSHENFLKVQTVKVMPFQPAITCSRLTIETLEQGVKYVQSFTPCSSVSIVNFEQVN